MVDLLAGDEDLLRRQGDPHIDDGEDRVSSHRYYRRFRSGIQAKKYRHFGSKRLDKMTRFTSVHIR